MKKILLTCLFVMPLLLNLSGCSSIGQSSSNELLVQYATIKFINNSDTPIKTAQRIIEISSSAKTLFDRSTLSIDEIEKLIRQKIKWHELSAEDVLLANALILKVKDEMTATESISIEQSVTGSIVLTWIISGARMAGG